MQLSIGGGAKIAAGHTLSATSNGVIEDGTLLPFTTSSPAAAPSPVAILTAGSATLTAIQRSDSSAQAGSQLQVPGGQPITLSGHILSGATNGIVEDGTLIAFSSSASSRTETLAVVIAGSSVWTASEASSSGVWLVGANTLTIGGSALTSNGQTMSAASIGLLDDGHAISFSTVVVAIQGGEAVANGSTGAWNLPAVKTAVVQTQREWQRCSRSLYRAFTEYDKDLGSRFGLGYGMAVPSTSSMFAVAGVCVVYMRCTEPPYIYTHPIESCSKPSSSQSVRRLKSLT